MCRQVRFRWVVDVVNPIILILEVIPPLSRDHSGLAVPAIRHIR